MALKLAIDKVSVRVKLDDHMNPWLQVCDGVGRNLSLFPLAVSHGNNFCIIFAVCCSALVNRMVDVSKQG